MKEYDIRPKAVFDGFLDTVKAEAERLFSDRSAFAVIPCPACDSRAVAEQFTKIGFQYSLCADCGSLYVSPRPPAEMFARFYRDSKSVEYFATTFYRQTEEARRERLFRPRAEFVAATARRLGAADALADIGAGYGTFLEEAGRTGAFGRLIAIEPATALAAVCREKGLDVLEMPVEEAAKTGPHASFSTCFEVFEHVHDPLGFVSAMAGVLRPGGVMLFTTLTISGFDLQELWEQSKSIMPPNHINLFSTNGLARVVERAGLELIEIATPGQLDVDIVANMITEAPSTRVSRFARGIATAPDETRAAFQAFLREHRLSSHVRVIARRKD